MIMINNAIPPIRFAGSEREGIKNCATNTIEAGRYSSERSTGWKRSKIRDMAPM